MHVCEGEREREFENVNFVCGGSKRENVRACTSLGQKPGKKQRERENAPDRVARNSRRTRTPGERERGMEKECVWGGGMYESMRESICKRARDRAKENEYRIQNV